MAKAKPTIATNVSDIPEILDDCGWIVEPEDPEQLAETIKYALNHSGEALEMGLKAREKCKREYSGKIMEEKLIVLIEKCKTD